MLDNNLEKAREPIEKEEAGRILRLGAGNI